MVALSLIALVLGAVASLSAVLTAIRASLAASKEKAIEDAIVRNRLTQLEKRVSELERKRT